MKKLFLSLLSLVMSMTMFAQSNVRKMNLIYDGQVVYSRAVSLIDSIKFVWNDGTGSGDDITGGEVDPSKQLYVGVVAFNRDVRQMAITSDMEAVKSFINEQTNDKDFTAFAYSVSKGNKQFDAPELPDFDHIFMLNFSDGTDNYSNMKWGEEGRIVNNNFAYDTARYDLSSRVGLNSYAIGFGAKEADFREKMKKIVMGSGSYYAAASSSDLQPTFNEIAKSMLASAKNVLLKTNPGYYVGFYKYFRLSFVAEDGSTDHIYAQMDGTPTTGYTLSISKTDNGYAYFDAPAKGVLDEETGKVHIPLNNLKFVKGGKDLQYRFTIEVSFDGDSYYEDVEEASTAEEISKRIAVVLVLDCSTSMGDAFAPMKAAAVDFIKTMEKMEVDDSEPNIPDVPNTPVGGTVTFDASVDKGNASTDSNNATAYQVSKEGVTLEVSSGILGTYDNELHYRVYKNQTLKLTSTVGNIVKVEFTCTANDDQKYGPGCFQANAGEYTYSGPVGTWTGNAASVVFTASSDQVRATQVVVTILDEGASDGEEPTPGETKDITVKAKVPAAWTDQITAWVWHAGGEGKEVIPTQEGEWYVYTQNCTELNIIFKNGAGWTGDANQTEDMLFTEDACIEITSNGAHKATYTNVECDLEKVYEYVDLGLSVKWATCNVGATKPEEYGDYFAWGEVVPKETYDWSTYKWCNGSNTTLTKYNTSSSHGSVDNKTVLEASDDAVRANWGGSWRMPTAAEQTELCEQCTWTWTTQNGVNGYKVTSKSNGNSIFLPAAGNRYESSLNNTGSRGYYWSSSLITDYPDGAWRVSFDSGDVNRGLLGGRCDGRSVRPVCQ